MLFNVVLVFKWHLSQPRTSLVAQTVKNLPAMQETLVRPLGWEDPLENGMVKNCRQSRITPEAREEFKSTPNHRLRFLKEI